MALIKSEPIERLTVSQMASKYPNRWLGLGNVRYHDDDGITIESGDVLYTDATRDELFHLQLTGSPIETWYTTDDDFAIGMVGVV